MEYSPQHRSVLLIYSITPSASIDRSIDPYLAGRDDDDDEIDGLSVYVQPSNVLRRRAFAVLTCVALRAGVAMVVLVWCAASGGGVAAARPLVGGGGAVGTPKAPLQTSRPFNIAHRGSNGELPEETAAAYMRAIDEGADFIEADVTATKDGHLVCFHDTTLDATTDVADHPEFASRRRTLEVQWTNVTGFFISKPPATPLTISLASPPPPPSSNVSSLSNVLQPISPWPSSRR